MWDDTTYQQFLSVIEADDPMDIATWLSRIAEDPSRKPAMIPQLETLLTDTRITTLRTPVAYGEVRWNAALALVMERQVQNEGDPVVIIKETFSPMGIPDILMLLSETDFTLPGGKQWIKRLRAIHKAGNLPLSDYEIRFGEAPRKLTSDSDR